MLYLMVLSARYQSTANAFQPYRAALENYAVGLLGNNQYKSIRLVFPDRLKVEVDY